MKIYKVGGAVRDSLLKRSPEDTDWVVVGANEEDLLEKGFQRVGEDFPVFLHPRTKEEYALARLERKVRKGYRGFKVVTHKSVTLEEDLARRDFTINAMASDSTGNIIDPYSGRSDLSKCLLRHVTEAFSEDPLRVLRAARFASKLNFSVAEETMTLMTEMAATNQLAELKEERIWSEFKKAIVTDYPLKFFKVLGKCKALPQLFPELETLFNTLTSEESAKSYNESIRMLTLIDRKNKIVREPELIFSIITRALYLHNKKNAEATASQMCSFCDRLKVPKKFKTIAKKASAFKLIKKEFKSTLGRDAIHLLDLIGGFKSDNLFPTLLFLYQIELESNYDAKAYVSRKELLAVVSAVKNMDKNDLIQQNLSGELFAEELKIRKISIANHLLTHAPKPHAT